MLGFGWWRDRDNREAAVALSSVLKVAVPAVIAAAAVALGYFYTNDDDGASPGPEAPSIAATGDAQVQTGSGVQVRSGDGSPVTIGGPPAGDGAKR